MYHYNSVIDIENLSHDGLFQIFESLTSDDGSIINIMIFQTMKSMLYFM